MTNSSNFLTALAFVVSSALMMSLAYAETIDDPAITHSEVRKEGAVLVFEIDNEPPNLVSVDVMRSLNRFMDIAANDEEVRALVITGKGDVFSAGGSPAGGETLGEMSPAQYANATFDRLEQFPLPVIAAINGDASQGGLELAMSTDIRIASDEASFAQREVLVGVIPGFGGLQRLPGFVGRSLALDMIISGREISAAEALSAGLVSRVSPKDQVYKSALELAQSLAASLPESSIASVKERLFESRSQSFSDALKSDRIAFDALAFSPEFLARMQSASGPENEAGNANTQAPVILSLPDGFSPDGITIARDGTIYVASIFDGTIVRGHVDGAEITDVLVEGVDGRPGWGMDLDDGENYLYVAGGFAGTARIYDAATGELVNELTLATEGIVNDLIVTGDAVYLTNSSLPVIYEIPIDDNGLVSGEPRDIPLSGDFHFDAEFRANANGIEYAGDGVLIVNHSMLGKMYAVDIETGRATEIDLGGEEVSNDGIAIDGDTLYGVEPPPESVAELKLSNDLSSATLVRRFSAEVFNFPTLVAEHEDYIYIVNGKLTTDRGPAVPYEIVRLPK